MTRTIAIPSDAPGGLTASISAHFGHCDVFTLVEIDDGRILGTSLLAPPDHDHGGCLAPVAALAEAGVSAIVTGGMGVRPRMGFLDAGIDPYFAEDCADVDDAARAFAAGELPAFARNRSCGGGGETGCCGGHDHG
ncbi:NifB/NifX family molybdenum-iron cluster-binding protein [Pinisolibacter aquiterrae]|uniref:NifB/NifX family molybdenum-iron cluster-binding protein n=1 Tax=Pinisolibacter aquiterrae TaxID=2815579 RepID=UPI001C3E4B31|nr:NifB/NifX family molybdenum-iron cluster-binding protein [Pinisolibacter aquiterrae]MCC8237150.1 NifB/NifX family molybdenum-iron cluster-binding protein [Pinisolibacter aquiterrae]